MYKYLYKVYKLDLGYKGKFNTALKHTQIEMVEILLNFSRIEHIKRIFLDRNSCKIQISVLIFFVKLKEIKFSKREQSQKDLVSMNNVKKNKG